MTTLAIRSTPFLGKSRVSELLERQPLLGSYGLALLALAVLTTFAQLIDPRTLDGGVNVWVKPTKFFVSVGLFALTSAWFFGYVRPERRRSWTMRLTVAALIVSASFELVWISWQASQGVGSHFNLSTPFTALMFSLMGLFALILTGTALPLAWEIARRPAAGLRPDFVVAVATGLVLTFILGTTVGAYMGSNGSHAVGPEGANLPIFGWNRQGGDLRIAHFLGLHAQQAIPLIAVLAAGAARATRWSLLIGGGALYTAVTLLLFAQAVSGRPLLPL